jgi:glutamate synthase domain-containing protein 3
MKPIIVILREVRVLATGMDGGHTYLAGRTDHPPHGIVDAYFDFEDRSREADFEARYA